MPEGIYRMPPAEVLDLGAALFALGRPVDSYRVPGGVVEVTPRFEFPRGTHLYGDVRQCRLYVARPRDAAALPRGPWKRIAQAHAVAYQRADEPPPPRMHHFTVSPALYKLNVRGRAIYVLAGGSCIVRSNGIHG